MTRVTVADGSGTGCTGETFSTVEYSVELSVDGEFVTLRVNTETPFLNDVW